MPATLEPKTKFTPDTTAVPTEVMQFDCKAPTIFASEKQDDGATFAPISMLGRSAEPINHWYWGDIVHDMDGFSADGERVPIDWCHDDNVALGFLDKFEADENGLRLSGNLISFEPNDRAAKLMRESAAGIPYQASIFFRADRLEYVPEGMSTEVNGFMQDGPAVIVREWGLRGMAVCMYGADHRTQSKFSNGDQIPISLFTPELKMPKKKNESESAVEQFAEVTEAPAEVAAEAPAVETPVEALEQIPTAQSDTRAELKRYIEKFGTEHGANWFAEGLNFEDAQTQFNALLKEKLAAKDKEIEELQTKLKSIDRGSDKPLSFSSPDSPQNEQPQSSEFQYLGSNLAKFASSLKLPVK
jgi:hypothetical protein